VEVGWGVGVAVGVSVAVAVAVGVMLAVAVGEAVRVEVQAAATAVMAVAVNVACWAGDGPQAANPVINNDAIRTFRSFIFTPAWIFILAPACSGQPGCTGRPGNRATTASRPAPRWPDRRCARMPGQAGTVHKDAAEVGF
jgi:hypothetical protein